MYCTGYTDRWSRGLFAAAAKRLVGTVLNCTGATTLDHIFWQQRLLACIVSVIKSDLTFGAKELFAFRTAFCNRDLLRERQCATHQGKCSHPSELQSSWITG